MLSVEHSTELAVVSIAPETLQADGQLLSSILEHLPLQAALFRGADLTVLRVSRAYQTLFPGRDPVGKTLEHVWPEAARLLNEHCHRVLATGEVFDSSQSIPNPPAAGVQAESACFDWSIWRVSLPINGGWGVLVICLETTDRRQALEAAARAAELQQSRARLDYAVRLSGVGFWNCDLPFDELMWDDRVKEHFFFPSDARITIDDFYARIHPEDREPTRKAMDLSMSNHTAYDTIYRTVDPTSGQVKWIRALGGADYAANGTAIRFDGVTVDVTAQKADQLQLAALNEALREQDRRKDEFLATLAHELRNPLAPIQNAAALLGRREINEDSESWAKKVIQRQVNHMARLLDDLLDVARITQGKLQLQTQRVSLTSIVDAAVEAVRPLLDSKGHELLVTLPVEAPVLEADPLRVSQILSNLLTNAAKYTDPRGHIELWGQVQGSTLCLAVKDDGIGIAPHDLDRIFTMFSQVEDTGVRSDGGLGIGLALVKGLVALHHGSIEAKSEGLGHGSEFLLRLPLAAALPASAEAPESNGLPVTSAARRILVADDNKDAADSLAMILALSGHQVRVAHDGRAALSVAQAFRPEVALLDLGMPGLDGYELARSLRREPWGGELYLVALTGWGQEENRPVQKPRVSIST